MKRMLTSQDVQRLNVWDRICSGVELRVSSLGGPALHKQYVCQGPELVAARDRLFLRLSTPTKCWRCSGREKTITYYYRMPIDIYPNIWNRWKGDTLFEEVWVCVRRTQVHPLSLSQLPLALWTDSFEPGALKTVIRQGNIWWTFKHKTMVSAQTGVGQWVGHHPVNWKILGSIPGSGNINVSLS